MAVAIAVAAIFGWGYLRAHLAEKEALLAAEDSRSILAQLRTETGLSRYQDNYDRAVTNLGEADALIAEGNFSEARPKAEKSRRLASSILERLRSDGAAGEAQFHSVFGNVETRRGDEGTWVKAKRHDVLEPGDWVRTGVNASAVVMFVDGNLFTVRPSTVILVERRRQNASGAAEQTISLEYGWVNMSTSEAESRVVTPRAEAVVAKRSEGLVAYDEDEGKTRFAAYDGAIDITTEEGEERTITSMQQVVQSAESLRGPSAIMRAPLLLNPSNNHNTDLTTASIVLSWDPVPGATGYALQISANSLFVDNVIDVEKREKTTATVGLRGDGNFHWHVAAHGSDGELGEWSEARKFRVNERSVTVEAERGG